MTRLARTGIVALLGAACLALSSGLAQAVPRYSARYEQTCSLCHVDPSGGGMRSTYATKYLVPTEMVWKPYQPEALERIEPDLSKSVSVGGDFRTMAHYSKDIEEYPNLFQMQGDLYVHFQADDRISLYLDKGMTRSTELFALGYLFPMSGYLKVGRFSPPFGFKFDDHRAFVRQYIGLQPPSESDVGVEFGFMPYSHLSVQMALLNGALGQTSDDDERLSQAISAMCRRRVLGLGTGMGASYWHNQTPNGTRSALGPMAYLHWKDLAWVGEVDVSRVEPADAGPRTEIAMSHEWTWEFERGLSARVVYDFYDPDYDVTTGSRSRFGFGFDLLPIPWVGLKTSYNLFRVDKPEDETLGNQSLGDDYEQFELQLHLFY